MYWNSIESKKMWYVSISPGPKKHKIVAAEGNWFGDSISVHSVLGRQCFDRCLFIIEIDRSATLQRYDPCPQFQQRMGKVGARASHKHQRSWNTKTMRQRYDTLRLKFARNNDLDNNVTGSARSAYRRAYQVNRYFRKWFVKNYNEPALSWVNKCRRK